jgi:hypothetical protein
MRAPTTNVPAVGAACEPLPIQWRREPPFNTDAELSRGATGSS